jgi:FAD/FMN-containing dehydrogenase
MKALRLDADRRVVWAETGLTAREVTHATGAHRLAVGFGDTGSVGIGGLTLGGGIGYLVRKQGLTIDNLLAAELVTADGRIRLVDAEHEPDLFWAIRGGGGNFGVATRFLFRLRPVATVLAGTLALPATPDTIAGFVAAAEAVPDELTTIAHVLVAAPPLPFLPPEHHGKPIVLATLVHSGPIIAAERAVAPFRELATPIADLLRPTRYPDLFAPSEAGPHRALVGRTLFVDSLDRDEAGRLLESLRRSSAPAPVAQLRVLGGAVARVPADATAYGHRQSRIMVNVAALYDSPEEAPLHEAWATATAAALRRHDLGAYVNFLGDEGAGRVRSAYPGATWERLRAIKRSYDPGNLFRLNQNIPPADDREAFPLEAAA